MKINIHDCKGTVVGEYEFADNCLEAEKGKQAVHDVVVAFLAGQRAGTACTKTRAEVRGGGCKPFRQKGLGRARAGSNRSPIWVGGGVTFGPKPRDFSKKINKKVRKLAMRRAFTERLNEGSVIILDRLEIADHKTKSAKAILNNLNIVKNVLICVPEYEESIVCATGNLAEAVLRKASSLNVYEVLRFDKLIFTKDALDAFVERLA
jgi:large subunit ribosomal protein L4